MRPDEPGRLVENGAIGCGKVLGFGTLDTAIVCCSGGVIFCCGAGLVVEVTAWLSESNAALLVAVFIVGAGGVVDIVAGVVLTGAVGVGFGFGFGFVEAVFGTTTIGPGATGAAGVTGGFDVTGTEDVGLVAGLDGTITGALFVEAELGLGLGLDFSAIGSLGFNSDDGLSGAILVLVFIFSESATTLALEPPGPGSIVARLACSLTSGGGLGTDASPSTSCTVRTTSSIPTCDFIK